MERVPTWAFIVAMVVFAALGIWSATDENWAGVIISLVLVVLCVVGLTRRPSVG